MWNRKAKTPKLRRGIGAFLDQDAAIDGRYTCAGTVVLNGKLKGEIHARDTLIIGVTARVAATVQAGHLIVYGEIVGNVTATTRVELKSGARVTGDVSAPEIVMEKGVLLRGQCRMDSPKTCDREAPSGVFALAR